MKKLICAKLVEEIYLTELDKGVLIHETILRLPNMNYTLPNFRILTGKVIFDIGGGTNEN